MIFLVPNFSYFAKEVLAGVIENTQRTIIDCLPTLPLHFWKIIILLLSTEIVVYVQNELANGARTRTKRTEDKTFMKDRSSKFYKPVKGMRYL